MNIFESLVDDLDSAPIRDVVAHEPFPDANSTVRFMLAGNARTTFEGARERYTFRVRASQDGGVHFVGLLRGQDNDGDYSYFGYIRRGVFFHGGVKAKVSREAPGVKAFEWTWARLVRGCMPSGLKVWHEGCCGRCGRALTVPQSIRTGFGPECAEVMGVA